MNAVTRVIGQNADILKLPTMPLASRPGLRMLLLAAAIFLTAFGIIVSKDVSRRLFIESQILQTQHEKHYETWGKLLLEQSTLSTQSRVQRIAQQRLLMKQTTPRDVTVIK